MHVLQEAGGRSEAQRREALAKLVEIGAAEQRLGAQPPRRPPALPLPCFSPALPLGLPRHPALRCCPARARPLPRSPLPAAEAAVEAQSAAKAGKDAEIERLRGELAEAR